MIPKLILHGLGIIGFVIGYGFMFLMSIIGLTEYYKAGLIDSSTSAIIITAIPVIGIIILIYWCLSISITKHCPKCKAVIN